MPRSSVSMTDFDGTYYFDIDQYLIDEYPDMNKPARRALCSKVTAELDTDVIKAEVDGIVLAYALELQGWQPNDGTEEDSD